MSNTIIQIKSSGVAGNVPATLQPGELAINYFDGQLFYGNSTSQSVPYATVTEPSGLNGELQFNDSGSFGSDTTLSFNGATKTLTVSNLDVGGLNVKPQIISSFNHANAAFDLANTLSGGTSQDSWARNAANAASSYANSAYLHANAAFSVANNATDTWVRTAANSASSYANSAYAQANTATILAQAAFDQANTGGGGGTSIGITDDNSTNANYYITFTDSTSGNLSSLNTSSSKLTFNPSTGTLGVRAIDVTANATISSNTVENSTGTQFLVDSFSIDEIRSAFYQVQIENSTGFFEVLNLNIIHDGSNVSLVSFGSSSNKLDYGQLENSLNTSTSTSLGEFTVTIVGSVLNLLFTPFVGDTVVSFIKNTIRKIAQFFPTGDLGFVADAPTVYFDLGYVADAQTSSVDYGGLN
jgi:hypothetical protein